MHIYYDTDCVFGEALIQSMDTLHKERPNESFWARVYCRFVRCVLLVENKPMLRVLDQRSGTV